MPDSQTRPCHSADEPAHHAPIMATAAGMSSAKAAFHPSTSRCPAGQPAALQKIPELLLDEAGQAIPVSHVGGLRAKGLDVFVHDLVMRTPRGTPPIGNSTDLLAQ